VKRVNISNRKSTSKERQISYAKNVTPVLLKRYTAQMLTTCFKKNVPKSWNNSNSSQFESL